ncbi:MAG: biofilm PGA synthesis protein PgaB [bacterium]|nr:biofilm PGA synthesis protein PgaB [bacterium]
MKKMTISFTVLCLLLTAAITLNASATQTATETIKVGVFNGFGASRGCITDTLEALKIDPAIIPHEISATDILTGDLDQLDVLVFAGGSGSRQTFNLGHLGAEKVRAFAAKKGKGIVGICAGAYILSDTPDYACLNISPLEAIDRQHDARGYGIIEFTVSEKAKNIFPELSQHKNHFIYYYEGPLCIPAKNNKNPYSILASIKSDVHLKKDAPAGITPGKPLFYTSTFGKGKLFLSVGHPETTPGMRWMVPRMVRWVLDKKLVSYAPSVVRPEIYSEPILFDKKMRRDEEKLFQVLIYGNSKEKIAALNKLASLHSWGSRLWFPALLRDKDPKVRTTAAKVLTDIEYTAAIPELTAVTTLEKEPSVKSKLQAYLSQLKSMLRQKYPKKTRPKCI